MPVRAGEAGDAAAALRLSRELLHEQEQVLAPATQHAGHPARRAPGPFPPQCGPRWLAGSRGQEGHVARPASALEAVLQILGWDSMPGLVLAGAEDRTPF